jgi:hypothetical protein
MERAVPAPIAAKRWSAALRETHPPEFSERGPVGNCGTPRLAFASAFIFSRFRSKGCWFAIAMRHPSGIQLRPDARRTFATFLTSLIETICPRQGTVKIYEISVW